jgi:hypothetical protein
MQENRPSDGSSGQAIKRKKNAKKRQRNATRRVPKLAQKRRSPASRGTPVQEPERHFFWITYGQINAGFVDQVDDAYKAISADEQNLGTFNNLTAAADAVSANFSGAR